MSLSTPLIEFKPVEVPCVKTVRNPQIGVWTMSHHPHGLACVITESSPNVHGRLLDDDSSITEASSSHPRLTLPHTDKPFNTNLRRDLLATCAVPYSEVKKVPIFSVLGGISRR